MGRLDGKVALITGGASGFGAAMSERFSQEGCKVLIGDLNESAAKATADKIGSSNIKVRKMDVTQEADWKAAVESCVKDFGRLDIVVNNAGWTYKNKPTLEVTVEEYTKTFDANVKSIFLSIGAVVPQLKKQGGGSIINISSVGAMRPRPNLIWYTASKGAVSNATQGLAVEYGPDNIRVNAICPALSGTGLFEQFSGKSNTEENLHKAAGNIPLGRLTNPMDVANTALFLASDEAQYITGVDLQVDGGRNVF
ncbi:short-chain dehydrogenase/reductase SDR [Rhizodiscina lignyota]|uniref:Short-chain dehydrogenase/reductase SDR n=1 Tax=Rhizodiscina lignyota TaxID=1504668 RepID=A0A9P4I693_9PEZI|nr:short-chain dehydrogenase/reductase SDR [Rhizodiscina lignyota]